ncbi:MAG: hypothetical protein C4522_21405 [Desulfobacteraceae bacterium]|nr:MAG: hypothetical protein C4522_21405 [Desulfobacteraceae bacterium]
MKPVVTENIGRRVWTNAFSHAVFFRISILIACFSCLGGCAGWNYKPANPDNICTIFGENEYWYKTAEKAFARWRIPIPVLMAIMYQESKYQSDAKPPRTTCLFFFPGPRPSSAYGYSQALDGTWKKYKQETGNWGADRDDFGDAIDFIGWYCLKSHQQCKIAVNDAYNMYLAYHEGQNGFLRKTHQKKNNLKATARGVKQKAAIYASQLASCEKRLKERCRCCLWPF